MYPWPTGDFDNAMDVALDTAMNYLERTGQAEEFVAVQRVGQPAAEVVDERRAAGRPVQLAGDVVGFDR